jgi:MFS transporter, DHA1 family, inner membrane transport protein
MVVMQTESSSSLSLWVLMLGNFVIGTGVLLPAGLLNDLSTDMGVSVATAGTLMLVGGLVVAFGAPLIAGFSSGIERRKLLTFALLVYALGHGVAAVVPSFTLLLVLRAFTVVGSAIFTPQAAATVGLLVPPEKRAAAIAFIFIGWSAASVAGIPLGSYLSALIGWRFVFGGMAVVCAVAAALVWSVVRPGLFVSPLSFAAWTQALTTPAILVVLLVTLLSMAGQFTVFSYIAPILRQAFHGGPEQIALAFAVAGVTGVVGNAIASRVVSRLGVDRVIAISICTLIIGLGVFAASFGHFTMAMIGVGLWGLGSFSSNSLQQSRLVTLAPALASATVALNTSVVFAGQAVAAGAGGWFISRGIDPSIAWFACGLTVLALVMSLVAGRMQ